MNITIDIRSKVAAAYLKAYPEEAQRSLASTSALSERAQLWFASLPEAERAAIEETAK